jgi:hypothetical protein
VEAGFLVAEKLMDAEGVVNAVQDFDRLTHADQKRHSEFPKVFPEIP